MAYDPHNRCVTRTINGVSTSYIYEDWNLIQEYASTAETEARRYIHGAVIDELVVMIDGSGTSYYHQDALGSTISLSDEGGDRLESMRYDIFGSPRFFDATGQPATYSHAGNWFFTGRAWFNEIGLGDYRNRYYQAELGRWLSRDSLPNAETIEGQNLYSYVGNSPSLFIDPVGFGIRAACCKAGCHVAAASRNAGCHAKAAAGGVVLPSNAANYVLQQCLNHSDNLLQLCLSDCDGK